MSKVKVKGSSGQHMDLKKLDPMARKMRTHIDAFYKALDDQDALTARSHINEITKYADYLSNDVEKAVNKIEKSIGVNDRYAGGVPVIKFNESGSTFDPAERNRVLKGTIIPSRTNPTMRNVSGTFGRWSQ